MVCKSALTDMVMWKVGWLEVYLYAPLIQTQRWLVVDVQCCTLATSPSENCQYPLYQGVGCPQGQSELTWRRADLLPPQVFEPAIIQPMTNLTYIQYVHK